MSARARQRSGYLLAGAVALFSAVAIGVVQPSLAKTVHAVKQRDDVFLLPPPKQLRAMTLGYRAAAVDLLWAKLIVEYGTHWQERRGFPDVTRYIDGILAIEPDHPTLYQFVDTFLMFTPAGAGADDARRARSYLERGTRERPFDHVVWLHYGQFVAFLAPSFLTDEAEIEAWRRDGALAIMKAVELGADPDRSLAASTILSKAGETRATIQHLKRNYVLADDPRTRRDILGKLERLQATIETIEAENALSAVENEWRTRYPFLSRHAALLLGPHRPPDACAGPASFHDARCPHDWSVAAGEVR